MGISTSQRDKTLGKSNISIRNTWSPEEACPFTLQSPGVSAESLPVRQDTNSHAHLNEDILPSPSRGEKLSSGPGKNTHRFKHPPQLQRAGDTSTTQRQAQGGRPTEPDLLCHSTSTLENHCDFKKMPQAQRWWEHGPLPGESLPS